MDAVASAIIGILSGLILGFVLAASAASSTDDGRISAGAFVHKGNLYRIERAAQ